MSDTQSTTKALVYIDTSGPSVQATLADDAKVYVHTDTGYVEVTNGQGCVISLDGTITGRTRDGFGYHLPTSKLYLDAAEAQGLPIHYDRPGWRRRLRQGLRKWRGRRRARGIYIRSQRTDL